MQEIARAIEIISFSTMHEFVMNLIGKESKSVE